MDQLFCCIQLSNKRLGPKIQRQMTRTGSLKLPYDLHVCMPPPPPPRISYIQTPHRTKAQPVLSHFSIAVVNITTKAFYNRKCLIILGFRGLEFMMVERRISHFYPQSQAKGAGERMEKGRKRKREKALVTTGVFGNLKA